ncbi:hypothetical protein OsJ_23297 [Oryza sativa Japonica Group]|uniref:non-specific serine/threonine protein kinase n=1 Tax=Oryza sativa subsp. japonica TaxID=39947 RepID=B9FVT0_ORYSJ|nr:hypothetical protein OsJ_23297 [Oryza sativa Japonica Group]
MTTATTTTTLPAAAALLLLLLSAAAQLCSACPPAASQTAENNPRLQRAYVALQALRRRVTDDPKNLTGGCVGRMAATLNELVVLNSGVRSCIPPEIGHLGELTVLDVSNNQLQGTLPESMAWMRSLEQLDVARNELAGHIPEGICALPRLRNFTYSYNYFCGEPERCLRLRRVDDRQNCIAGRPDQRPADQCLAFLHRPPVHCDAHGCFAPPGHY